MVTQSCTYIAAISLHLQIICQGEEMQIRLREDLQVTRAARKVCDELDRFGTRGSQLQERGECGL